MPFVRCRQKQNVHPISGSLNHVLPYTARTSANAAGPLASAMSQTASATAPSDSMRPVMRCRLDSHIVICHR
jgi:hypothetical protein